MMSSRKKPAWFSCTGGTGSGKTPPRFAALLNEINQNNEYHHIVTLEDPIGISRIRHLEVHSQPARVGQGLLSAFRMARAPPYARRPKIILVGEIRDRDTMEIALTAGETGHIVYSTLHTISAGPDH